MDTITTAEPMTAPTHQPTSIASYSQVSATAMIKGNQIVAAGCKELGELIVGTVQSHLDRTLSAWQAVAQAKSVKDVLDVQTNYVRTTTQTAFTETGDFVKVSSRLARDAVVSIMTRSYQAGEPRA